MKVSQTDPYSVASRRQLMSSPGSGRPKMLQERPISFSLREFAAKPDSGRQLALLLVAVEEYNPVPV
jgi:hypothetical protein